MALIVDFRAPILPPLLASIRCWPQQMRLNCAWLSPPASPAKWSGRATSRNIWCARSSRAFRAMISFVGLNHNVIPRAHALLQKKNLSWLGMGWGLAFLLILIQAWER